MSYGSSIAGKLLQMAEKTQPVCAAVNGAKVTCGGDIFTISDALEAPMELKAQPGTQVQLCGKNLIDVSIGSTEINKSVASYYGGGVVRHSGKVTGAGYPKADGTGSATLRDLCPSIIAGQVYTLQAKTTCENKKYIYLQGKTNRAWTFGSSMTVTEDMLSDNVLWYGNGDRVEVFISDIQLEVGSTSTEFEAYRQPKTADASGQVITAYKNMTVVGTQVQCSYFPQSAAGIYGKYTDIKAAQEKLKEELNV